MKRKTLMVSFMILSSLLTAVVASYTFNAFVKNPEGFGILGLSPTGSMIAVMLSLAISVTASFVVILEMMFFRHVRKIIEYADLLTQGYTSFEVDENLMKGGGEISELYSQFSRLVSAIKLQESIRRKGSEK